MSRSRTPSPSPEPELRRRRTVEMYDNMEVRDWEQDLVTIDDERYLRIDGTNYRILDSGVTEFDNRDKPLVSVGANLSRELVILDPTHKYLQCIYEKLKNQVRNLDDEDQDIQGILNHTINFVRDVLKPDPGRLKEKVDALRSDPNNYMRSYEEDEPLTYKGIPVILLDTFMEEGFGLCRHHALLAAYLIHNLVLDGLLPPGHIFSHRDTVRSGGAHVWTIYKPIQPVSENDKYNFYLVDSLWNKRAYNLRNHAPDLEESGYGARAIQYCVYRHNKPDIESIAYTKIGAKKIKDDYIYDLLDAEPEMRRKFLNHQHSLGACKNIKTALMSSPKFKKHNNYDELLDDLDRVLDKTLYESYYAEIQDSDDRQQFVLALLCKSEDERNLVLGKQDIEDLRQLKRSLITESVDRKSLYQKFETYKTLLSDVENRLETKLLHQEHYDEIEESDDRQRFMTGLLICKSEKEREAILDRQNIDDLKRMKISLDMKHSFYGNFHPMYGIVLADIEKRIALKEFFDLYNHYDVIQSSTIKQKFVTDLLSCRPDERRSILNNQNIEDLVHLHKSLTYWERYRDFDGYPSLVKDIEEHLQFKNLLHKKNYHSLGRDERKQFITGLLHYTSEQERRSILDKQNITDIKHLKKSLMKSDGDKELPEYESVMREINRQMILRSLYLLKGIIRSGKLEVSPGNSWTTVIWTPGKKLEISPDESLRIPTCAQDINKKINEVDLESSSLQQLLLLTDSLKIIAKKADKKNHSDRTDSTRLFLSVLKDDYEEPIELLEAIEKLQRGLTAPVMQEHQRQRSLTPS